MGQQWAEQELSGINLGDARLNKRSVCSAGPILTRPIISRTGMK
ncbi:MAG: Transposase DNA-binding [Burkholderia sp.]|nr:Transposase DNA-binding [Burkholderia sp.]